MTDDKVCLRRLTHFERRTKHLNLVIPSAFASGSASHCFVSALRYFCKPFGLRAQSYIILASSGLRSTTRPGRQRAPNKNAPSRLQVSPDLGGTFGRKALLHTRTNSGTRKPI